MDEFSEEVDTINIPHHLWIEKVTSILECAPLYEYEQNERKTM